MQDHPNQKQSPSGDAIGDPLSSPSAGPPDKNYLTDYTCSGCGARELKLWRELHVVELKCAACATPTQVKSDAAYKDACMRVLDADGVFTFTDGDQLGGLVPAVPAEDGVTFWNYSSVPSDRVQWWHALPTYRDTALEVRGLRNILARTMQQLDSAAKNWLKASRKISDLAWRSERKLYRVTKPATVTIYGWGPEKMEDGRAFRYGKEMPRSLECGDMIAEYRGRAVLLLGETFGECPSIMDHDQDGSALVRAMIASESIVPITEEIAALRRRLNPPATR